MSLADKIKATQAAIRAAIATAARPALMCSFGKDSMVLLDLIRATIQRDPRSAHAYPLPVIYYRDPWFAHKHAFAEKIIRSWGLEAHDFPPLAAGVKVNEKQIELVARYSIGLERTLDIPRNVAAPADFPRRDYLCGLRDWLMRPKAAGNTYPWDCVFVGHKSADVDEFHGAVPLRAASERLGPELAIYFPLREWTDADVWNYLQERRVPYDVRRYGRDGRPVRAREDHWHNNDWTHACTACIDPRNDAAEVHCPKLGRNVPNVGHRVLQLGGLPEYVTQEEEASHAV